MLKKLINRVKLALIITSLLLVIIFALVAIPSYQNTITPSGIIIHHSAIPFFGSNSAIDAALISEIHQRKGYGIFYWGKTYYIGYHYVILPDGTLQQGRPETCQGAHTLGHNDKIGICLIGEFNNNNQNGNSFQPAHPTPEQLNTLANITKQLLKKYNLSKSEVYTHNYFNSETECPGKNFLLTEFIEGIN